VLNEVALRRPGFFPGTTVRLTDGQNWTLPGPACPRCCGDEYEALLEAIREAGDDAERLLAELALAIYLMECNYHLTPASYEALLDGPSKGPLLRQMQHGFHGVAATHVEQRRSQKTWQADGGHLSKSRRSLSWLLSWLNGHAHPAD
jgi:hypothetical protein